MEVSPTVTAAQPFDPIADSEALKQAFKGFGCDEKTVMDVIARRSNQQRQILKEQFKVMYGKDLVKELKSELRGNFEDVIVALMMQPYEFYAKELHGAVSGIGTNEKTIIEILATHNNEQIIAIREAYEKTYRNSLESDLKSDTSGTTKRLMVSLVTACRDESNVTNQEAAYQDAQNLLRAGELIVGTHESEFNSVFCQRNRPQLNLVFDQYKYLTGHDIEVAIEKEFSGTDQEVILDLIQCVRNPLEFLADRLYKSMVGFGTDDRTLIRIIVSRSEIDLGIIKNIFASKYDKSLADFVREDTSGDYKNALLLLIG